MVNKVKIGEWEICCSKLATAVIDNYIRVVFVNPVTKMFVLTFEEATDDEPYFLYCPYCGGKLP